MSIKFTVIDHVDERDAFHIIQTIHVVLYTSLKPMYNIGKVSVNASILYKNQEICNKTNL